MLQSAVKNKEGTMGMRNNYIVVDLGKVQYAKFYYRNQFGQCKRLLPKGPTTGAAPFDPDEMHLNGVESLVTYAHRTGILDVWVPEIHLQLQANHSLYYTGEKAKSLWKEWNRKQFNKR